MSRAVSADHGNRLQEGHRFAERVEGEPAHGDAMAAHIAQHAAALAGGVPEPGFVRAAVLFGRAGQRQRPHGPLLRGKLGKLGADGLHEDLVLEIGGFQADRVGQVDHLAGFLDVAPERFFADEALEPGAFFDGLHDGGNRLDAGEIGHVDSDGFHVLGQFTDVRVNYAFTQVVLFHVSGQAFGVHQRGNSNDFDVAHLLEGLGVKMRHEPSANDPQFKSGH